MLGVLPKSQGNDSSKCQPQFFMVIATNIVFERNEQDWNKNHSFSFRFFINFADENK